MTFSPLSSLQPKDRQKTIRVSVHRKWEFHGTNDDGPLQHIDMILIDDQGNQIYAEIPATEADKHGPIIHVGGTYVISRFIVCNAKSGFRAVDWPYMLEFTCHTKISVSVDQIQTPKYIYKLTAFEQFRDHINDNKKFHDILAIITEVNEPQWVTFMNQANPTLRRDIRIRNESGYEVRLSLWGQKATQFALPENITSNGNPVIALFTGCLIKTYMSEIYISGRSACHWYINPDIPEAEILLKSLHGQSLTIKQTGIPLSDQIQPQSQPLPELLTLREMENIDPYEFPENGCQCTVTIIRLLDGRGWWYPACNLCHKACKPDGATYRCFECDYDKYTYRYKLPFIASDGTEEAEMIAFAATAQRIVGKPAETVMRSHRNRDAIPSEIAAIISTKYTFSVTISEESFRKPKKSYQVSNIISSHGKQPTLPFHSPNQKLLQVEARQFYGQSSSNTSYPGQTLTPSKTIPLQQITLETPPKDMEATGQYNISEANITGTTNAREKSAKKRLQLSETTTEEDENDNSEAKKSEETSSTQREQIQHPNITTQKITTSKSPKAARK